MCTTLKALVCTDPRAPFLVETNQFVCSLRQIRAFRLFSQFSTTEPERTFFGMAKYWILIFAISTLLTFGKWKFGKLTFKILKFGKLTFEKSNSGCSLLDPFRSTNFKIAFAASIPTVKKQKDVTHIFSKKIVLCFG